MGAEHNAATQGGAGRRLAQNVTVTGDDHGRLIQAQLDPTGGTGGELFAPQEAHGCANFGGPTKEIDPLVVGERSRRIGQQPALQVDQQGAL